MNISAGRCLVVASLLMVAGGKAFGAPSGEGPPAHEGADDGRTFGNARTLVITGGTHGWRRSAVRDVATGTTSVSNGGSLSLTVDAFLIDRWSLGVAGQVEWAGAAASAEWSKEYTLEVRLGRAIPLGAYATLWPVLGVGASRRDGLGSGARTGLVASVDAPLLVHPTRHVFVGAGPTVRGVLDGSRQSLELSGQTFIGGAIGR